MKFIMLNNTCFVNKLKLPELITNNWMMIPFIVIKKLNKRPQKL